MIVNYTKDSGWVDGEDGWYYYLGIVEPGKATKNLIDSLTINPKVINSNADRENVEVKLLADAMQADNTGVTVDVTGNGTYANGTHVKVGYADKDLFSNMKDLMPGDTVSNTVNLQNQSSRGVSIYMKAYPDFTRADETGKKAVRADSQASPEEKTFKEDILNKTEMTLTLGGKVIYQGSADGASPMDGYEALTAGNYGIRLGYFGPGKKEELVITLVLPGESLDNAYTDRFDAVDWVFCVEGTTPSGHHDRDDDDGGSTRRPSGTAASGGNQPGPDLHGDSNHLVITDPGILPKMGDAGISGYIFGILAALLIGCGALYMRKRYRGA